MRTKLTKILSQENENLAIAKLNMVNNNSYLKALYLVLKEALRNHTLKALIIENESFEVWFKNKENDKEEISFYYSTLYNNKVNYFEWYENALTYAMTNMQVF